MDFCVKVLDHGYLKYIEHYGSDERIIEAARMSTGKGFLGWEPGVCPMCQAAIIDDTVPELTGKTVVRDSDGYYRICTDCNGTGKIAGDINLLRRLWTKKHATPFEMAGLIVEVQAPIMVFREWHRHRTQCLAGNASVWFNRPCDGKPYQITMEQLAKTWYPKIAKRRRKDQSPLSLLEHNRSRLMNMSVRIHNGNGSPSLSNITDVILSGEKPLYRLYVDGKSIDASADHRFETPDGWFPLSELANREVYVSGATGDKNQSDNFLPELSAKELACEEWREVLDGLEVSNLGRVRSYWGQGSRSKRTSPYLKSPTISKNGRAIVSHRNRTYQISRLVWFAFYGNPLDAQVCHKDDNALDNRLENLYLGDDLSNANDRIRNGKQQRLKIIPKRVTKIEAIGTGLTYDLSIASSRHNFIANGFVTHNSYNEMSARYVPLPDVNYVPSVERLMLNANTTNRQAGTIQGASTLTPEIAEAYRLRLKTQYLLDQELYNWALQSGVPKELARVHLPVGRYSRMRAAANLRNWLAFLTLRMAEDAQWEIRQYANEIGNLISKLFPRTWGLFIEGK